MVRDLMTPDNPLVTFREDDTSPSLLRLSSKRDICDYTVAPEDSSILLQLK
jgi:hypothetical protein